MSDRVKAPAIAGISTPGAVPAPQLPGRQVQWIASAVGASLLSFVTRRLPGLSWLPLRYSLEDHSPTRYIEASRSSLSDR